VGPVNFVDVPAEHLPALKQLENLGLVYRRNCRSCGLQRHRLVKMLKRESQLTAADKQEQCWSVFRLILELEDKPNPADSPNFAISGMHVASS
jgi:hypothetical protein